MGTAAHTFKPAAQENVYAAEYMNSLGNSSATLPH